MEKLSGPSERLHEKVDSQEQVGGHDTGQGAEEPRREIKLPRLEVKLPEIKLPEIKFSKREDRAQLKRERDAELAQTEISAAEDYLCKIIDIRTRRVITPLKICVVSPCATGVTFVSCNLAYYLAQKKKQVMLLGDEDCLEYLGNNRQNITLGYSSGQYDVAIVDTHAPHEADLYVLVYTPDLHYIPKIKQMELTISGPKLRMLNKSQPMPISNEKILGFKPDAVIPAINNPRQILLARPAVLDYKEVQNAFTTIFQKIGGFFCDSEGQISQYAGN
ncbi:hypothetical protein [Desulfurispora thermophila]|uniref:hypothetical protein n=1 Tax=Desulfurispora thermophila TaxID=265470 RepID=UPI0014616DCC|nr:hypothetical protein [Desulfurispora thermophila]